MSDSDETRVAARTSAAPCCCWPSRCAPEPARDVLDRRYAKGELTQEQYEAMKRDLERS